MTIQAAITEAIHILQSSHIESATSDARILMQHALGITPEQLILKYHESLTPSQHDAFQSLIHRRLQREPIAYIRGAKEFWSMPFIVNSHTLIPRPETEQLVEIVASRFELQKQNPIKILDVGTGSGAIAISLAKEFPHAQITALDISPEALAVATQNAMRFNVNDRISFLESDLYTALPDDATFDVIVSNPPYIPSSTVDGLEVDVKDYEPRTALDGGKDGLFHLQTLLKNVHYYLKTDGFFIFEICPEIVSGILEIIKSISRFHVEIIKDHQGNDRFILGFYL